jgi:SpoVK/Ycf46/Vps4 family AAA+-type ATPase
MENISKAKRGIDAITELYGARSGTSVPAYCIKFKKSGEEVLVSNFSMENIKPEDVERLRSVMMDFSDSDHTYTTHVGRDIGLDGSDLGRYSVIIEPRGTMKLQRLFMTPEGQQDMPAKGSPSLRKFLSSYQKWNAELRLENVCDAKGSAKMLLLLDQAIKNPEKMPKSIYEINKAISKVELDEVGWEDIGGLDHISEELRWTVAVPTMNPEVSEYIGLRKPSGILLTGPPGNGKSLIAMAVGNQLEVNFINMRASEILSSYHTESERNIASAFEDASQLAKNTGRPTILFCDEIDRFSIKRGMLQDFIWDYDIVNAFIAEMESAKKRREVIVMGATNVPWLVDEGFMRPGRFEKIMVVPPPSEQSRLSILGIHSMGMPLDGVNLGEIAKITEGYSGSHLKGLCSEASKHAARRMFNTPEAMIAASLDDVKGKLLVTQDDFLKAAKTINVDTRIQKQWMDDFGRWSKNLSAELYVA